MQKLPLVVLSALTFCSSGFAQEKPASQIPATYPILDFGNVNPIIEKQDDATITIAADKPEYDGVNTIKLDIALTNRGEKPFSIVHGAVEEFFYIEVIGPDGKKVSQKAPRGAFFRDMFRGPDVYDVRSKQSVKATVWLSSLFDMSEVGSYKITAQTYFRLGTTGETYIPIKSAPIIVKVNSSPPIAEWR